MLERTNLNNSGVIHEHIDAPKAGNRFSNGTFAISALSDVSLYYEDVYRRPLSLKLVGGTLQMGFIACDQREASAFGCKLASKHESKTSGASGNQDGFALEGKGIPRPYRERGEADSKAQCAYTQNCPARPCVCNKI